MVDYDLAIAQSAAILEHGKCMVKIGLALAMAPSCYSRIAPRSSLALKKFTNVGVGVIDRDYRGEVGVALFNLEVKIQVNMTSLTCIGNGHVMDCCEILLEDPKQG